MKELSVNEMHDVKGGSKAVVGLAIVAGITFLIGVIDGFVRPLRCNWGGFMKNLNKNELVLIEGGSISGTLISSITRGINTILDMGRSFGNAIRRIGSRNICPM